MKNRTKKVKPVVLDCPTSYVVGIRREDGQILLDTEMFPKPSNNLKELSNSVRLSVEETGCSPLIIFKLIPVSKTELMDAPVKVTKYSE